jgi:hypothetical protein
MVGASGGTTQNQEIAGVSGLNPQLGEVGGGPMQFAGGDVNGTNARRVTTSAKTKGMKRDPILRTPPGPKHSFFGEPQRAKRKRTKWVANAQEFAQVSSDSSQGAANVAGLLKQ